MKTRRYMRHYVAWVDDGVSFFEVEYTSEYRANSKENRAECQREMERRYGKRARHYRVLNTYVVK